MNNDIATLASKERGKKDYYSFDLIIPATELTYLVN